jgi:hypothetical protein
MKIIQSTYDPLYAVMDDNYTEFIIKFKYRYIEYIKNLDIFYCKTSKFKYQLLNSNGEILTTKEYDDIYNFQKDFDYKIAIVEFKNKYGIIYKDGIEIIPCTFNNYYDISNKLILSKIKQHERNLKLNLIV